MIKHLPNFLTSLNILIGCVGIHFVTQGKIEWAIYFVVGSACFDFLDGFVARLLQAYSEVGKQLDSLADLISFGVLPGFFLLKLLMSETDFFWIAFLVPVFSAIRLAIFNVDDSQSSEFRGLPTPANAIAVTSLVFLPFQLPIEALFAVCLISSFLLVAPISLIALKFKDWSWKSNAPKYLLIILSIVALVVYREAAVPFIIPLYLAVSFISKLIAKGR